MTQTEYHTFISKIQEEEFPGIIDELEHIPRYTGANVIFAPSHHFRTLAPLMTEEIVADLKDNRKNLLSVGCGPAYLERLLVSRLGVKTEQITLADISNQHVPRGFEFFRFDMHQDWPEMGKTFDYVIFPESPFINTHFSGEWNVFTFRQPDREQGLYRLLVRALTVLRSPGQARLTDGSVDIVREYVKKKIEAGFSNVTMYYSNDLTAVTKR